MNDPLYTALLKERFSSTWWVTTEGKPERDFDRALSEVLVKLDRYETVEAA